MKWPWRGLRPATRYCAPRATTRSGLGYRLWDYYSLHMMDLVFLYMIVLGFLGLLIDRTFRYVVQERLLRWQEGLRQN